MKMSKIIITFFLSVLIRSAISQLTIVNGTDTEIELHPWQVATNQIYGFFFYYQHCGGSIIGKRWILSAAHCFQNQKNLVVRAGTSTSTSGGIKFQIKKVHTIPSYNNTYWQNDVAIIELEEEIQYNSKMKPIEIVDKYFEFTPYQMVDTTGYGRTCFFCSYSEKLMESHLSIVDYSECVQHLDISNGKICARDTHNVTTSK